MIKYPSFNNDSIIGIAAVSDGSNDKIDVVINKLKELNNKLIVSDYIKDSEFQVSESAKKRAKEFVDMWTDNKVGYIIAAFGGEFCMEVLPYLDSFFKSSNSTVELKNKITWFQGFSDASFINYYLTTNYNISTIHSYNAEDYGTKMYDEQLLLLINNLQKFEKDYTFEQTSFNYHVNEYSREDVVLPLVNNNISVLNGDNKVNFSGTLIGGWIEALSTICGTKYDNTINFCYQFVDGMVWYIDNCELNSPMLRRKLWQLKEAGYFNNCNGILIGRLPRDNFNGQYDYIKALSDSFEDLNIPIITGVDIGHFFPQWVLINGSYAKIEVNGNSIKLLQKLR